MNKPRPGPLLPILLLAAGAAFSLDVSALLGKKLMEDPAFKELGGGEDINLNAPDNSIDPARYMVGGGDGFHISFLGLPSQEFTPVINQEGDLYIRDFGIIKLGRITLAESKRRIESHLGKAMKGRHQPYVVLNRIKRPMVSVGGAIGATGTYQMNGTMRLLDALKLANHGALPSMEAFNYREVERRNGDSLHTFDLLKFLSGKDINQNPYVYPGDQFILREVDRFVYVTGELSGPVQGKIPLKAGENLADVLDLVQPRSSADSSFIMVRQSGLDSGPTRRLSWSEAATTRLSDRDAVSIGSKENYLHPATATVLGEAVRPGIYPIMENVTTAGELLALAGGPRATGNSARAYVIKQKRLLRESRDETPDKANTFPWKLPAPNLDLALTTLRKVRPEMSSSINDLNILNDHAVIELDGKADKVPLEKGDRIYIPKKNPFVYVSGSVKNPGAFPFKPGKHYGHYVSLAGGYTSKADRANQFILTTFEDMAKIREIEEPREGDVIVVPASIEYKTFNAVILPIIQLVPGIASLILSLVLVANQ